MRHTTGTISIASFISSGSTVAPAQFGTTTNHKLGFFTNNGSPSVILDTNGRLGINQATPQTLFHVTASASNSAIMIDNSLTTMSARPLATNAGSANCHIWADGAANGTADAGFLRIAAGGGAGIGNKSYIDLSGYSGTADMNQNIVLGTCGTERMRIRNDGNVGIGTTSPFTPLHVNTTQSAANASGNMTNGFAVSEGGGGPALNMGVYNAASVQYAWLQSAFINNAGVTRALALNPVGGNVGIGTTSPAGKLEVQDTNAIVSSTGTGGFGAFLAKGSGTNNAYLFFYNATNGEQSRITSLDSGVLTFSNTNGAVERMQISAAGSVIVGTAAISTSATDGFLYIPTTAGTPTGVPTAQTGRIAMVYDTTNHQFWFYDSGWKQPKTPAAAAIITWQ
jgi:hypothetical protein